MCTCGYYQSKARYSRFRKKYLKKWLFLHPINSDFDKTIIITRTEGNNLGICRKPANFKQWMFQLGTTKIIYISTAVSK